MLARELAVEMALAEAAKHVHEEGGANTGARVREYQAASSLGGTGWAWCDAFCDFCFAAAGRPLDELERSAGVERTFELAQRRHWLVHEPKRGDLVCFQWDSGPLDHIGFVVQELPDGTIKTVEGNTAPMPGIGHAPGEGDGVYVKIRPRRVCAAFIRVPGAAKGTKTAPKAHPPGYDEWARWVKGKRRGKRPDVPETIPQEWWARLAYELDAARDEKQPHPNYVPAHA